MQKDWKAEAKRPVTLGLAALALVGWIIAISQTSSLSSSRANTSAQINDLAASRRQLATELDQQQNASGTLADLQGKAVEVNTAAAQLAETNKAGLAAIQAKLNVLVAAAAGWLGASGALLAAVLHNVGTLAVMANAGRLLRFQE